MVTRNAANEKQEHALSFTFRLDDRRLQASPADLFRGRSVLVLTLVRGFTTVSIIPAAPPDVAGRLHQNTEFRPVAKQVGRRRLKAPII